MNNGIKSILLHLMWIILCGEFQLSFGEENVGAKVDLFDNNKCELNEACGDSSNTHSESPDGKMLNEEEEFFTMFITFFYYIIISVGICVVMVMYFSSPARVDYNQQKPKVNVSKNKKQKPKPKEKTKVNNTNQKEAIKRIETKENVEQKQEEPATTNDADDNTKQKPKVNNTNQKHVMKDDKKEAIKRIETGNDLDDDDKCGTKSREARRICAFCGVYISYDTTENDLCVNCQLEQNELEQLAEKMEQLDADVSMSVIERIQSSQYIFPETVKEKDKNDEKDLEMTDSGASQSIVAGVLGSGQTTSPPWMVGRQFEGLKERIEKYKEDKLAGNEQWHDFVCKDKSSENKQWDVFNLASDEMVGVDGNTQTLRNVMRSFNEFKDSIPSMGNVGDNDSDQ